MSGAGWSATPRGRRELAAVGLFCLAFAVTPLVTTELYPFSRAPMFADAPRQYCDYAVITPDGRRLTDPRRLALLGLQRNYWATRSASASASSRPRAPTCSARRRRGNE